MRKIIGFLLVSLLFSAAPVWAQQAYLSGNLGFGVRPNSDIAGPSGNEFNNDPALVVNGAIGVEMSPILRIEGEVGLHYNSSDVAGFPQDFTFSAVSFMGNGYFDIPTQSPLRPYVGAGLGFALVGVEEDFFGFTDSDSDMVAAFQFMAGLGFDITPKATLTFGYRYFTTTDPSFNLAVSGPFKTEYSSHDFLFGARFRF
ncbi:MAG: outer membrane beta-barrel protein [Nitrospinota bacterium]|nr:outer membrane beta-barrel protein [Nitrospinota bacterium]